MPAVVGDDRRQVVFSSAFIICPRIVNLQRRTTQFSFERNGGGGITKEDVDNAFDELLFKGGSLNLKLLGAGGREPVAT